MSTVNLQLYSLFGSKTRVDLLMQLITHPGESFYIRQLAALIKQSPTPVVRELSNLENMGIVVSESKANAKYYSINTKSSIFPELKSLIFKTLGFGDIIRKHFKNIKSVSYVFIYGSFATGEAEPKSDIDLMIIGKIPLKILTKVIKDIETRLNREIQYSIFDTKEFLQKLKMENDFILQVVDGPKIMLIGGEDEFRRFAEKGLNKTI